MTECQEITQAIDKNDPFKHVQEEIGDLLQSALSMCVFYNSDVNQTLEKANIKFAARINKVKQLTAEQRLINLKQQTFDFKLNLWKQAKK